MRIKYQHPLAADGKPIYERQVLSWNGVVGSCEGFETTRSGSIRVIFKNLDKYGYYDYPAPEALVHVVKEEDAWL